ncbi:hypothetical protein J2S78_001259 [Salibacterium salarium]|uniref:UPF0738 family protein n=1 Tax=Salibacterium salarium TaxID=284579 RepID=UPI00278A7854|nr:hypothetical protein [Salibacterium salarium]MDQ0298839.1 hypothetical protein [Salibacterium salarium]
MEHVLTVTEIIREGNKLYLKPIEDWPESEWEKLEDGGRMLADSDALTLVYVLESVESFVQLRMPKQVWPHLKEASDQQLEIILEGPSNIRLDQFQREMAYILDNVPGNGNYGSAMVEAVEEAFQL